MTKKKSMIPLNEDLTTEFTIQQLEERLETDPLLGGEMADLFSQSNLDSLACTLTICFTCTEFSV